MPPIDHDPWSMAEDNCFTMDHGLLTMVHDIQD